MQAELRRCAPWLAREAARRLPPRVFLVSVYICTWATMSRLNAQWRRKKGPTDILSFPQWTPDELDELSGLSKQETPTDAGWQPPPPSLPPLLLGDLVYCPAFPGRAERQTHPAWPARARRAHVFVHGFLHLLGYDHPTPGLARPMEALESRWLCRRGYPDPWRPAARDGTRYGAAEAPASGRRADSFPSPFLRISRTRII